MRRHSKVLVFFSYMIFFSLCSSHVKHLKTQQKKDRAIGYAYMATFFNDHLVYFSIASLFPFHFFCFSSRAVFNSPALLFFFGFAGGVSLALLSVIRLGSEIQLDLSQYLLFKKNLSSWVKTHLLHGQARLARIGQRVARLQTCTGRRRDDQRPQTVPRRSRGAKRNAHACQR